MVAGLVPSLPDRAPLMQCSRKVLVLAAMEEVTKNFSLTMNKQTLCCSFFFFFNRERGGIKQRRVLPAPGSRTLCLL